jgi:hypothetical protein
MSPATDSDNVIQLAPFRAQRLARRPAKPYMLWYPGVGFVVPDNSPKQVRHGQRHSPQLA